MHPLRPRHSGSRLRPFLVLAVLAGPLAFAEPAPRFTAAKPVWPEGRETTKNLLVGFRAAFAAPSSGNVLLRATGASLYRVWLNGAFLGQGPARGPHGHYRVDEWDLKDRLGPGTNVVAIEVAGYNVNSYYLLDQPSFLQAEVVSEGRPLAATGMADAGFQARLLPERVQKVQRYSFQRPFSEVYRLAPDTGEWRTHGLRAGATVQLATQPEKALLPRRVPYPDYRLRAPGFLVARGSVLPVELPGNPWKDRSLTDIGPKLGGYPTSELATIPSLDLQRYSNAVLHTELQPWDAVGSRTLKTSEFVLADFGVNLTGFIGLEIAARRQTRLYLVFDEVLSGGDVDFKRLDCVNALALELEPGAQPYRFESFEPYTLRYLKVLVADGECGLTGLTLRELANPDVWEAQFAASDERFNRLFAAGRETFRQNATDLFMDCPSRERAGWLCDSFFTARVARDLCGDTRIERNFLENYLLPAEFPHLPEGMLPMCYPADHNDGVFIPNWALWFVAQLEEYLARSGDRALVSALEPRVLRLFDYFRRFRNPDGLLEKLEGWVFVEWSKANEFVQDVNYPSNMLYAHALAVAGRLYGRPDLLREAEAVRTVIRRQAFDGEFFVDNARRNGDRLEPTRNRTEVGQYFAFYFGIATPETHPRLWLTLVRDFGPARKQTRAFPEVHPANAFIGNVLRLELLSRQGRCQQVLDESLAYQLHMVERTGTLWEHDGAYASCNHGFASHGGVHALYRDVLGLHRVDPVNREVHLRFTDLPLEWCEGRVRTPEGWIELRWRKEGGQLRYACALPAGYSVRLENRSRLDLSRMP